MTNYPHAEEVYPIVVMAAWKHGLRVFDAKKHEFASDVVPDKTFVRLGGSIQILTRQTRQEKIGGFWRIQKSRFRLPSGFPPPVLSSPSSGTEHRPLSREYNCSTIVLREI